MINSFPPQGAWHPGRWGPTFPGIYSLDSAWYALATNRGWPWASWPPLTALSGILFPLQSTHLAISVSTIQKGNARFSFRNVFHTSGRYNVEMIININRLNSICVELKHLRIQFILVWSQFDLHENVLKTADQVKTRWNWVQLNVKFLNTTYMANPSINVIHIV